ncbi:MAG TPA: helical backbone metal receptor [Dehalococcoidia bacterium]|nr:helical backbone metal receptor [Dehalococcoidia bacterium]
MTRKLSLLFVVALTALLLAACGGDSGGGIVTTDPDSPYPLTVRQSDGQEITIRKRPERIVSLSAHATEIFCAIGAGSQLVAVEQYANCPLGSSAKPQLDGFSPSLEAIASYRPDLVYVSSNSGDVVQGLRRLGMPVLYLELPASLGGVLEQIRFLGNVAGRAQEAGALTNQMERRIDAVRQKVASISRGPRVYHELDTTYFTVAPGSFVGDLYVFLKAENIAAGASSPYPQLSAEVIVQRNPQVIVLADEAAGVTADSVRARPGWSVIEAVRNNRICIVDPDIVSRPGPRIVDGLEALGRCLYPEQFR